MPDDVSVDQGLFVRSWLATDAAKIAHYFPDGVTSACHMWTATTLDRPAPEGGPRCHACAWAVKHGV